MNKPDPSNPGVSINITFIYFRDLPCAERFYGETLGFPLAIDQGWCKIFQVSPTGHIGLVDEARGHFRASDTKPIILCMRVPDADAWYDFLLSRGVKPQRPPRNNPELGIRAFFFLDTEGHTIEIQSLLPDTGVSLS